MEEMAVEFQSKKLKALTFENRALKASSTSMRSCIPRARPMQLNV
jgi:hypothetical protein